ncbi:YqeG family HAD IIIA-type phosphatase [Heliobacterium chlorum]|uniref:YqeG family HAD IIIA-type phosphatase n=1 Tax=Heliobacterium chlorum TaxID=2698 RepID=A0ABR7T3L8_HELCL|nr:YqeG family HAD IIIA-type phosphatase [Heliobacterium chlorum]
MRLLKPAQRVEAVHELNVSELTARGIKGIIIDLDNTLTEWNEYHLCPKVNQWLSDLEVQGIKVCILSNNKEKRVQPFAAGCRIPYYISGARKPRRKGFIRAMQIMGTTPENTIVIGDQIFTDVLGGNRSGIHTVLVNPISRREFFGTRMVRRIERMVLREKKPRSERKKFFMFKRREGQP